VATGHAAVHIPLTRLRLTAPQTSQRVTEVLWFYSWVRQITEQRILPIEAIYLPDTRISGVSKGP
jgi:hypothetical protein